MLERSGPVMPKAAAYRLIWCAPRGGYELLDHHQGHVLPVLPGSPAWFAWLTTVPSFTFEGQQGHLTVRQERKQRGGTYWYAYRRQGNRLAKRYLGRTSELTLAHLEEVAASLSALRLSQESHERSVESRSELPRGPVLSSGPSAPEKTRSSEMAGEGGVPRFTTIADIPYLRVQLIQRQRLLERFQKGRDATLTLVSAPAGFGKTTSLAQWLRACSMPVAWLSLEPEDNEPVRFLSALIAALQRFHPLIGTTALSLLQTPPAPSSPPTEMLLKQLTSDLHAHLSENVVLVLDDYQVLTDGSLHQAVTALIEHAPPRLHLVMATRVDPPLPLARWRAQGQLCEVRATDLQFRVAEIDAFLAMMTGRRFPSSVIGELASRTEGWITGLHLAALSLQGRPDDLPFLEHLTGSHRHIVEYLTEEVLARQPEAIRSFLLHTSLLDRFSGPLCQAVTGRSDSEALLDEISRANLFLISLDERGIWYRYYHLFAEALRALLCKREPEGVSQVYRRASRWCEEQGSLEEACAYAYQAGDLLHAAKLLAELVPDLIAQGNVIRLRQWLARLSEAEIGASPVLSVASLWTQLSASRSPEAITQLMVHMERHAQRHLQHPQASSASWGDFQRELSWFQALSAFSHQDYARTITLLHEMVRSLSGQQTAWSQFLAVRLRILLSLAYRERFDLAAAEQVLLDLSIPQLVESSHPLNLLALNSLAEVYEAQGRLRTWGSLFESVFQMLGPRTAGPTMPLAVLQMSHARLLYEWDRLSEAAQTVQQVLAFTAERASSVLASLGHWMQARIELAQGHTEKARHLLDHEEPSISSLAARFAHLALVSGQLAYAWRWEENHRLEGGKPFGFLSTYTEHMTRVRVWLTRGRIERNGALLIQALAMLEQWQETAENKEFGGSCLEIQMLTALVFAAQGKTRRALRTLGPLLAQAEAEGYVRLFADEGEMMGHLLAHISAYTSASPGYLQRLQSALLPTQALSSPATVHQPLLEPLTSRERDVLRGLSEGYSNQQIAQQLVISLNTVKRHVKHLLAKLTATNRTQAVIRARELRLL